jgi:regulator of protease activity HflC (stomatin/prohibitin superfamily)
MFSIANLLPLLVVLIAGGLLLMNAVRVVQEYERGVIFRPGRLVGARGPGLIFVRGFAISYAADVY